MTNPIEVRLWGSTIGAVYQPPNADYYTFQFDPGFSRSQIEVAPLMTPLSDRIYAFPQLAQHSFFGLPGLLADSLPDYFGNALINAWLAREGRDPSSFNALERLCYVGSRGMGALEYRPVLGPDKNDLTPIEIDALVLLAGKILESRINFSVQIDPDREEQAMAQLLQVGTSAGGARAKALIAWNPSTNEVRSGQVQNDAAFESWIIKFDGIRHSNESNFSDPLGYGAIEYAYYLMAKQAGIEISESRLMEENGRRHFMTRRFDRTPSGEKIHMLSLGGMAHYDFNLAGAYGYEQAFRVIRTLGLPMDTIEEQFRRMVFNVMVRNQDDHVKNIAFLMPKNGRWKLSPAYDLTYSFNPSGEWTATHQMTINGKSSGITWADLKAVGEGASIQRGRMVSILDEVRQTVACWKDFFNKAQVDDVHASKIGPTLLFDLPLQ